MEQIYESVCDRWSELSGVQFLCKGVEWERIIAEVIESEDGFGIWEVETLQVGIEACFWGAEVGNAG